LLTISSVAGTATGKTDIINKTFHHPKTRLKESAVPVNCSLLLCVLFAPKTRPQDFDVIFSTFIVLNLLSLLIFSGCIHYIGY
jgi:hypothetical protein